MRARDYAYFDAPFLAFAHRGGALLEGNVGRENTLEAFARAVDLGYRYLETDVQVTRDGRLVAFHDEELDRVSDRRGKLVELSWDEVRAADVGGSRVPLLDELLDAFPDARFNIDLKAPGAVEPLARAINAHRAHDRVCVGSFGVERIRAFRRLMGRQVATAVSPVGVAWTAFVPGLPRLIGPTGVADQMPISQRVAGREVRLLTPRFLAAAHARGAQVHIWTVDDEATMDELIDLGVDGIFTDRPDVLRRVLLRRGLWS